MFKMQQSTTSVKNSRKRVAPAEESLPQELHTPNSTDERVLKRRRVHLKTLSTAQGAPTQLATPPLTTNEGTPKVIEAKETLNLSLKIMPSKSTGTLNKAVVAARKGAAKRWQPKLQNPFPGKGEINKAYNLKLMRHYPGTSTDEMPRLRPTGERSARVMNLLKKFPVLEIPSPPHAVEETTTQSEDNERILEINRENTEKETAVRLAWKNFSIPERSLRGAMVESGLNTTEWSKEFEGEENTLPEWIKWRTSKFLTKHHR